MAEWTRETWNQALEGLPGSHLLQTWQWAEMKSTTGWAMIPRVWRGPDGKIQAAAMVLQRSIRVGGFAAKMSILYIPRGPVMNWADAALRTRVLNDLQNLARHKGAIFLKIDPELELGRGEPGREDARDNPVGQQVVCEMEKRGWLFANDQVQFRNTIWIDLAGSPGDWLKRMKQKTRYNIRLAERKGVSVRQGGERDLPNLYRMYAETSVRDGFVIRPQDYYVNLWKQFMQSGMAAPLIAEVEEEAVAGMVLFWFGNKAWYLHGMSVEKHREKMPNHLLQWAAMNLAHEKGALIYDLWGAPDNFNEEDGMWGVYKFKEGLGGEVIRTLGAWDYPSRPILFQLYEKVLPRILDGMRRRGKQKTRQDLAS